MSREDLLARVRHIIARRQGVTEQRLFGCDCFLVHGNLLGGVTGDCEMIVRVGRDDYDQALAEPHVREMDFTGRPMRGFVVVEDAGLADDANLRAWLDRGHAFARSLPPKKKAATKKKTAWKKPAKKKRH